MVRVPWLADVLRDAGQRVVEEPGWVRAGHGDLTAVRGVMLHHTAGTYPSDLRTVRDGATGTADGPLANLYLAPDGRSWHTIAAGLTYHAGKGGPWRDVPADKGNAYLIGVEVSDLGTPRGIRGSQYEAMIAGTAALLRRLGFGPDRCLLHRTYTPRKIDLTNDLGAVRRDLAAVMAPEPKGDTVRYFSAKSATEGLTLAPLPAWQGIPWPREYEDDWNGHADGYVRINLPAAGIVSGGVQFRAATVIGARITRGPVNGSSPPTVVAETTGGPGPFVLALPPVQTGKDGGQALWVEAMSVTPDALIEFAQVTLTVADRS